jgi:putative sterol carrier protein
MSVGAIAVGTVVEGTRPTREGTMTSPTTEFFDALSKRGHEPMLDKAKGTVRFDLTNRKRTERWLVSIDKGDITVSHKNAAADTIVRAPRAVFDGIATGEVNALAAILRGAISVEGESSMAVLFQRLFPPPPKGAKS